MNGEVTRLGTVAWLSFRGSLRGGRLVGLAGFALVPAVIVGAIAFTHPVAASLSSTAEDLFALLTLPIIVMVIVLVLSVGQFRNEIDSETLVYLTDRSVKRVTIVVGKYLGALTAALVLVIPATILPLAIASLAGGISYPIDVPATATGAAILAAVAYGGFFLFLGLISRSALLIGLLYGFLWEELLPLLPGDVPRFTVIFYLRSFLSWELSSGPLSGFSKVVSLAASVAMPVGLGAASVVLGAVVLGYLETAPERVTG
jgi:ABC-2 type transport system permease protein